MSKKDSKDSLAAPGETTERSEPEKKGYSDKAKAAMEASAAKDAAAAKKVKEEKEQAAKEALDAKIKRSPFMVKEGKSLTAGRRGVLVSTDEISPKDVGGDKNYGTLKDREILVPRTK